MTNFYQSIMFDNQNTYALSQTDESDDIIKLLDTTLIDKDIDSVNLHIHTSILSKDFLKEMVLRKKGCSGKG